MVPAARCRPSPTTSTPTTTSPARTSARCCRTPASRGRATRRASIFRPPPAATLTSAARPPAPCCRRTSGPFRCAVSAATPAVTPILTTAATSTTSPASTTARSSSPPPTARPPPPANTSTNNPAVVHYAPLEQLQTDLNNGSCARYNLITPDQYNDMHTALSGGFTLPANGRSLLGRPRADGPGGQLPLHHHPADHGLAAVPEQRRDHHLDRRDRGQQPERLPPHPHGNRHLAAGQGQCLQRHPTT